MMTQPVLTSFKKMNRNFLITFLCVWLFSAVTPVQARNFQDIQNSGTLRVLVWSGHESYLPREGSPLGAEKEAIQLYASQQGLQAEFIAVENFADLIPTLKNQKGDVIVANMTVTRGRQKQVDFTDALANTSEYLVIGKNAKPVKDGKALNGREVAVQKGTAYVNTALGLQKVYPEMKIRYLDENLGSDDIMDLLAEEKIDITIEDGNTLKTIEAYRRDIKRSLQASGQRNMAWAVDKESTALLKSLNDFLKEQNLSKSKTGSKSVADTRWQEIQQEKIIRFVVRNNMASYFIWRGELHGFNYELARHFTKENGLRYQIIVAPDHQSMLDYIVEGKADIALGFLTPTKEREAMGIAFSRPYHYASEVVVTRSKDDSIQELADLNKRRAYARQSSSYWDTLQGIKKEVPNLNVLPVAETLETEEVINLVAMKTYDITVADNHILDLELTWRDDVQSAMVLGEPKGQSWAVNAKNKELLKHVNLYLKKQYRGLFYNVSYKKYFKNQSRLQKIRSDYTALKESGKLSPYDDLVKVYAEKYDFDWRLLVAQMHQESRFDPNASSWSGAQGLFQVMPRTAKEMGIDNLEEPENGIRAGVQYLNWVRDRAKKMSPKDEQELIWFTLASYNAGSGHVRDAIRLAKQKGYDGSVWFGNVEQAMLLLSKKEYASKARYGYVRGEEPVTYIRNIKKRYNAYQHVTE